MAPQAAQVRYLEVHCRPAFTEAAQAVTGRLVSVTFKALSADETTTDVASAGHWTPLDPALTLDRFVTGPCNRLAHSAATAVAAGPSVDYDPLYVYGAAGLGKTHLLQGIVRAAAGRYGGGQCRYVSCEGFVNDAVRAMEDDGEGYLREQYGTNALLALDDVQFLAGRERSQEEFFHILNLLSASQHQVVASGNCVPTEIPGLQPRLASRLSAGLVAALDDPCLETRMAIIRDKANLRAIDLPADVVRLIGERYEGDVRQLTEALARIDMLSEFERSPITIELATRAIKPGGQLPAGKLG